MIGRRHAQLERLLSCRSWIELLLESWRQARQAGWEPAELALELQELLNWGASRVQLRLLVLRQLLAHVREVTAMCDAARRFQWAAGNKMTSDSCFYLTAAGARFFTRCQANVVPGDAGSATLAPQWKPGPRELWHGNQIVKRFRQPAHNQERILAAFQEQHWPLRIDDPLPGSAVEPKTRLRAAIRSLNSRQQRRLLRFWADGTGEGVGWEAVNNLRGPFPGQGPLHPR